MKTQIPMKRTYDEIDCIEEIKEIDYFSCIPHEIEIQCLYTTFSLSNMQILSSVCKRWMNIIHSKEFVKYIRKYKIDPYNSILQREHSYWLYQEKYSKMSLPEIW